jgi:catecholate siderophore receptor
VTLASFGPGTAITRGTPLKIQDMDTLFVQSDVIGKFAAFGLRHTVQARVDFARENKQVCQARNTAQGGVNLGKPTGA